MPPFAEPTDVSTAYEGSLPVGSEDRILYLLDVVSARLRILLPTLQERASTDDDLATSAKDVVVQAVLRRLPGGQQTESQTQTAGPYSTTFRYTTDRSGTFPDQDLDLLRGTDGAATSGRVGTIKLGGLVAWHDQ